MEKNITCLPLEHHKQLTREITPKMRYDGSVPMEEWKQQCRQILWDLLGMDSFEKCDPCFRIEEEDTIAGFSHIRFTICTEETYSTICDLLLPEKTEGKLPLCVCLQGHTTGSHISLGIEKYAPDHKYITEDDCDYGLQAASEGYAMLAIEQRNFGQCGGTEYGPDCTRPVLNALLLGRTTVGERVWDVMRALDAVEIHFGDIVTLEGSVLLGLSGGGTATYYTACLEDRFDGIVSAGAVCTFKDSIVDIAHCGCNYIPGIAPYFDMGDMAAMILPKKLIVVTGVKDPIFPIGGVEESYRIIEKLYAAAGIPADCALVVGEGAHRFYAAEAWPVIRRLMGKE